MYTISLGDALTLSLIVVSLIVGGYSVGWTARSIYNLLKRLDKHDREHARRDRDGAE